MLFDLHTKIIMGGNRLKTILEPCKHVFIVTDRFMATGNHTSYITDGLDAQGTAYTIFSDVVPDPDIEIITAGVSALVDCKPDAVIAFGGGSPIDAAKAIVFFANRTYDMREIPFIAIPTTSGTGSEVTQFAVISDKVKQIKYPLVDASLLPDYAVLDATLTLSVPPSVTADTGIDVFTHAIEAYVCTQANAFTDALAEKAIRLVYDNLLVVYAEPQNLEARQNMHNASCLAGAAFSNGGLGLNHGMAHALGARFHLPHGRANGILLPYVISYNAGCNEGKLREVGKAYAEISSFINLQATSTRQSALNLVRTTSSFVKKMGIPRSISAAGVSRTDFAAGVEEMAQAALADRCTATNPRVPTLEEIITLYWRAYEGVSF